MPSASIDFYYTWQQRRVRLVENASDSYISVLRSSYADIGAGHLLPSPTHHWEDGNWNDSGAWSLMGATSS